MDIKQILDYSKKPALYDQGSAVMWTDPYISEQLLQVHLNPDIDLASRKPAAIEKTASWILSFLPGHDKDILDLGCGPGLYTEILANAGHRVTGVDFSKVSTDYAKKEAKKKGLNIKYYQQDYRELDLANKKFDLVIMIYTDFGVLTPTDRNTLLQNIKKVLKPGGLFIFDVLADKDLNTKVAPRSWEVSEKGFWRPVPHIALSESFLYEKEKVILSQHTIIENSTCEVYRFWTHYFNQDDLDQILSGNEFIEIAYYEDIIPGNDLWSGEHLTFCKTSV